jgi:hypothetical protein
MIVSFRNKALQELFETGRSSKIDARMHKRILVRLDRLAVAARPEEMNLPGFDFHSLRGPTRPDTPFISTGLGASRSNSTAMTPHASISNNIIERAQTGESGS